MGFKNTLLPVAALLQSKGNLLDLSQPVVMGIINVNPDSFYAESRKQNSDDVLKQAEKMIHEGAAILDIGGASTRPGAEIITPEEEQKRILPAIEAISRQFPQTWISVDTYHASVAEAAIQAGAHIVNDISAGSFDKQMLQTVARLKVPYIAMHLRGSAATMHQPYQYDNITIEVIDELRKVSDRCQAAGITDLILDPGFGFAKKPEQSFELLNNMGLLRLLGKPLLAGLSRKSMIYKSLGTDATLALNGTTALNMVALQQGAQILRVHDVQPAAEAIKLFSML
ncbi:MAG TPA: dihydropteroate synthase [Chitinophagaceae bacterium]|nr:dihydropteroate synthase [Chitinophagaceae bacterium]